MDDYDTFLLHHFSLLRKSDEEEHTQPPPSSSLIRFYGQPILPPPLSGEQREEMQRHRATAQKAAVRRKLKDDSRMAYVQTILSSVQLRKVPTLEELLQESEINAQSAYSLNTSGCSVSQSNLFMGTKDSLPLSPPPGRKENDGASLPPLMSTTYSAFFASDVTPQQSYQEGCLIDQHYSQQGSPPNHQSVSSGYVTYENVENTTSASGRIDAERESSGSSEAVYDNNDMGGFFLHNTSNTIAKMPDIICHPPVDGEELERSGLELSFCNNVIIVKDISCTSLQEDSAIGDHLPVEQSESNLDRTEGGDNLPFTSALQLDKDHISDRIEGTVSSSDNLESSPTLSTHHSLTTELHIQHNPTESEPADNPEHEAKLSEEPHPFSLQALLKKSQYQRRQRMLRNQAKRTKIQERAQEQTRARAKEQNLSDKENDEFPDKGMVTTEGEKTKERRGDFILSLKTSPKKSWENERMIESECVGEKANFKSESTPLTGDGNTKEMNSVEEDTIFKNNKLNMSQEVITEPTQQQPMSTETSPVQEPFCLTTGRAGKYHTVPVPSLCRSPVYCKSKDRILDGDALDGAETSKRKVLVNTGLNEGHKFEDISPGHKKTLTVVPSTVKPVVEGNVMHLSAKSSQHSIDQLEFNLSSLKGLISDLESTLTETLKNHGQTESNTQSEFSFKRSCGEWPRRQSLDNLRDMQLEDIGPEPSVSDTDDVSLIAQAQEAVAVDKSKLRIIKALAAERKKKKLLLQEGFTQSYGQHGGHRKPTAKCALSATQLLRIPDGFRNVASTTSPNVSVLSDTSNRPAEGHNSTHLPSLNQSYDVNTSSGLWRLEGSGSNSGSKGCLVQETHLTPESGGEDQGGVSKVKRRLLMHKTEEMWEKSADGSRGAGSEVLLNSNRPRDKSPVAAAQWYEGPGGQDFKQEQLKQVHDAQIRALQDEHKRQQEALLQALAVHYSVLQSVSFPCSMSSSHLGDTLTFSTLSQPSSPHSERYRPLLCAALKGFLVRRLLRTERVVQLVRTVRDTHQFLQQSHGRGEICSRPDLLLQERVTLQLRAARYEIHDIFFSLSVVERMQLISWDRELRQQRANTNRPRGKSSLSTATQKSLERRRGLMIQNKAAERNTGVAKRTGRKIGFSAEQPAKTKRGQFIANPQRVPKSTRSSRPR